MNTRPKRSSSTKVRSKDFPSQPLSKRFRGRFSEASTPSPLPSWEVVDDPWTEQSTRKGAKSANALGGITKSNLFD